VTARFKGPPDLAAAHRLILVRHGQTAHTSQDRISGFGFAPQPSLDAEGVAQAQAAGRRLAAIGTDIHRAVASPQRRAQQTASLIAAELGLASVGEDRGWAESHFGAWEGLAVPEVIEQYPGAWESLMEDPTLAPPGGESLEAARSRVRGAWEALYRPGETTLVVTHLTPIRIVVSEVLQSPHTSFMRVVAAPGSITVVDRWADGGTMLGVLGERP